LPGYTVKKILISFGPHKLTVFIQFCLDFSRLWCSKTLLNWIFIYHFSSSSS